MESTSNTSSTTHEVVLVFAGTVAVGPPLPEQTEGAFTATGPLFAVTPPPRRRSVDFLNAANEKVTRFASLHFPAVFTTLESDGRQPDDTFREFGIWHPFRERLQVTIDADAQPGTLRYVHDPEFGQQGRLGDPAAVPTAAQTIEDFAAIPDMRFISPKRSTLRRGVLGRKATGVGMQVFVPKGTLRGGANDDRRSGRLVTFKAPDQPGTGHSAIVVPQLRVTLEVKERLVFESRSLDSGELLDPISFPITGNAEIWITNVEADYRKTIMERLESANVQEATALALADEEGPRFEDSDIDFVQFYDLVDGAGDIVLPFDLVAQSGERKCYVVVVSGGGGT